MKRTKSGRKRPVAAMGGGEIFWDLWLNWTVSMTEKI